MGGLNDLLRRIDHFHQRLHPLAFLYGVVRKFGDDNAGSLAGLIAYYGFLSLFPLLLVLVTATGLVLAGHPTLRADVVQAVTRQLPGVGRQLTTPQGVRALRRSSLVGLVIGLVGLLWGALGVCQVALYAMAQVWNVPQKDRPGFLPRVGRSLGLLAVLGVDALVTTALAGVVGSGEFGSILEAAGVVLSVAINVGLYWAGFRLLTPRSVPGRDLVPGAALAGVVWSVLQFLGGYLVAHELRNSSELYGTFALVLGLLWWLYIGAEMTLYAAEFNVVLVRRLWPRSLTHHPLTPADRRMAEYLIGQARPGWFPESTSEGASELEGASEADRPAANEARASGSAASTSDSGGEPAYQPIGPRPPAGSTGS